MLLNTLKGNQMDNNCVILIDCRENFQYPQDIINYLKKYKPKFVINANYPVDIWVLSDKTTIFPDYNQNEYTGIFNHLGESNLTNNSTIEKYLDDNNIKYFNITDPIELISLNEFKEIESITIMGSAWHRCLHDRPVGFNFLPEIINSNIKILTYSFGCCRSAEETIDVDDQIKLDKDWIPTSELNIYEYIGTR